MPHTDDTPSELSGAEESRARHRDRKRRTRMVVDNAGIKRVLPALRERKQAGGKSEQPRSDDQDE
jgi:hypothetical protein